MKYVELSDTPHELSNFDKSGHTCVVIDILRATTTIQAALAAGALSVWACGELETALMLKKDQPELVLAGERGGIRPEGFDLGNSPLEFTPKLVSGQTVVLTTTNGTRALAASFGAKRVLTGCYLNARAILNLLDSEGGPCFLACAGHEGTASAEDRLFAGFLASELDSLGFQIGKKASIAAGEWMANITLPLEDRLFGCPHGQALCQLGFASDVRFAAQWDTSVRVPQFTLAAGQNIWVGI